MTTRAAGGAIMPAPGLMLTPGTIDRGGRLPNAVLRIDWTDRDGTPGTVTLEWEAGANADVGDAFDYAIRRAGLSTLEAL